MKIHKHLILEIFNAVTDVFFSGQHADKTIERYFKNNRKWGSRDRRFFAENVYDMVRWWRKVWFLLGRDPTSNTSELWKALGVLWLMRDKEIPNLDEFKFLEHLDIPEKLPRAVEHSIPDWLDQLGFDQLGDTWEPNLRALNRPADVILRVNTLKTTKEHLIEKLRKEGIETFEIERLFTWQHL